MKPTALSLVLALCLGPVAAMLAPAPIAAAQSPEEVARYADDLLTRNYPADGPGAAILVARGDQVLFRGARGEADLDADEPLRPDSVFRIASVTKQFTAAGLLTLVEAGRVDLDAPLSDVLPDFGGGDGVTVRQLLNHTAGLKDYTGTPGYGELLQQDLTTAQLIDLFETSAPDFQPGASWAYSNSGYVLIGAVIEAVTGLAWHDYLDRALFQPLDMTHTGYALDPGLSAVTVTGYSHDGRTVVPMHPMSMTHPHAAGALVSTVDDLFRWNRALHEGRVLKNETYAQMIAPAAQSLDLGTGYGFGLYNETVRHAPVLRHGGAIFGFSSSLAYVPGPDITVVVLENDDATLNEDNSNTVMRRLTAMALGEPYPAPVAVPVEPAMLRAAEGTYRFDDAVRTLRVIDGTLTVQRGASPPAALIPISADDFLYADGFNRLTLERDAADAVKAIRFFARGDGDGVVGVRAEPGQGVAISLSPEALERLAGTYANGALTMVVFIEDGALKARMGDQEPVGLRASSATGFDVEQADASLEFPAGEAPAEQVIIRQGGRSLAFRRASEH
ncbi:serine hydrolase domain-containing protein [Brevundimonas sp.]|uniref:serine hydrolase domain-containing protein n=1 Tax=Brevundimonas sp. TaxID=1871086 RepID=UPI002D6D9CEE|nr:serine hydrolase domain-containing protein [Brevundimonas sp.]HYC69260.1 serine hydrolase domain-containing protein [Brevundimonas sp.]